MSELKKSVPYNEDQEQEIEALQAIFMENFKFENGEISIDVVPHFGGADSNFIQVRFKVRFPPEYPNVALTSKNFKLEVNVGALHPSYISDLEQTIISESQNYLGQPMLFLLVEHIKEKLEMYNLDLAEGLFVLFSDEIVINILSFLDVLSLAKLAIVSKKLKRLSEDDILWRNFVSDGVSESEIDLKQRYIEINELRAPELEYISAVMERKGTGDEWQSHLENWREAFKRKLFEEHNLKLGANGQIIYKTHVAGYYRFWERENVENVPKPWLKDLENFKCPYTGRVFGYIRWYPVDSWRKVILHRIPECSRGITVNSRTGYHFFSVVQDKIFLSHLFSTGNKSFMLTQPGPPVRYLNDLVEFLNKKISRIVADDKMGKYKGFGLQYIQGTWLVLDNYAILQELESKWGKIWMFHAREEIDEILS